MRTMHGLRRGSQEGPGKYDQGRIDSAYDKMFPRLAEPDGEGIYLNPKNPRRRFIAVSSEVEAMFETMTGGNYDREPKEKKKTKKPEKKGYKFKEDPSEDLGDRHVANASRGTFYHANPLTEEDLAELAKLKKC